MVCTESNDVLMLAGWLRYVLPLTWLVMAVVLVWGLVTTRRIKLRYVEAREDYLMASDMAEQAQADCDMAFLEQWTGDVIDGERVIVALNLAYPTDQDAAGVAYHMWTQFFATQFPDAQIRVWTMKLVIDQEIAPFGAKAFLTS